MHRDLLLLTNQWANRKKPATLSYRLVLPRGMVSESFLSIDDPLRIWWAERLSNKVYLKACLDDCKLYFRQTRFDEQHCMAIGNIDTSVYIYRERPTCVLEGIIDARANGRGWQTIELNDHQASYLVRQKAEASPIVLTLGDATRVNKRVLRSCWPQEGPGVVHLRRLWKTFKRTATLSELVRLDGLDPYETSVIAAFTDIDSAFTIKEILQHLYINGNRPRLYQYSRDSTRIKVPSFIPLDSLNPEVARAQPTSRPSQSKVDSISLEHEAIVARLASGLASMNLVPYLSPLVDLAVIHDRSALFFEVKTVDQKNLLDQVRAAIGQLMEYRFIYRESFDNINLALVAAPLGSSPEVGFAKDFVKYCGIDWVFWHPGNSQFELLEETVGRFYYSCGDTVIRPCSHKV